MQWSRWLDDLPQLKSFVDRCLKSKDFIPVKSVQLHIVSDGSRVGYGTVDYLCFFNAGRIHCSFVIGSHTRNHKTKIGVDSVKLSQPYEKSWRPG